jgi:FKBP-type peptidyl-prolyl cis-trans isomerase
MSIEELKKRRAKRAKRRHNQRIILIVVIVVALAVYTLASYVRRSGNALAVGENMITTDSGLQYQDLAEGSGPAAQAGDMVRVHYTGWLEDGAKFDSSLDRDEPFEFQLGAGYVIPGWDEGVAGMREGGKRQLVIPPGLAYGSQGAGGVIPPNAKLIFEIELLAINP